MKEQLSDIEIIRSIISRRIQLELNYRDGLRAILADCSIPKDHTLYPLLEPLTSQLKREIQISEEYYQPHEASLQQLSHEKSADQVILETMGEGIVLFTDCQIACNRIQTLQENPTGSPLNVDSTFENLTVPQLQRLKDDTDLRQTLHKHEQICAETKRWITNVLHVRTKL